jgi:hypothetical protein
MVPQDVGGVVVQAVQEEKAVMVVQVVLQLELV